VALRELVDVIVVSQHASYRMVFLDSTIPGIHFLIEQRLRRLRTSGDSTCDVTVGKLVHLPCRSAAWKSAARAAKMIWTCRGILDLLQTAAGAWE
jgi:hypothetical protein